MNRDAILLVAAFIFAFITFNWSSLMEIAAQFKAKIAEIKAARTDSQDSDEKASG